ALARRLRHPSSRRRLPIPFPPPTPRTPPLLALRISNLERTAYYHCISPDLPELLYCSDRLDNPFPIPMDGFSHLPTKTIRGISTRRSMLSGTLFLLRFLSAWKLGTFAAHPSRPLLSSPTARTGTAPADPSLSGLCLFRIPPPPRMYTMLPQILSPFSRPMESRERWLNGTRGSYRGCGVV
ncbi:hypothetical protein FA95DRAFT_257180, partial [Auriscalpium vulgare]